MLSIVIPAFNEESVIGGTIADVMAHFRPFELIVVSDGSTDRTDEIVRQTPARLIRIFLIHGIPDTQCGLKAFRADVARQLFAASRLNGFSFDFEVLYLAQSRGMRIARVPVALSHRHASRVRLFRDSVAMLLDLIRVRFIHHRGTKDTEAPL